MAQNPAPSRYAGAIFAANRAGSQLRKAPPVKAHIDTNSTPRITYRPPRTHIDTQQNHEVDQGGHTAHLRSQHRQQLNKRFGKTNHIHGYRHRLRQEEDHTNGATKLQSKGTADQVVRPTPLHARIGRNGRQRQGGQRRNQFGQQHNPNGMHDAGIANHLPESQKHDHAEDRQRAWGKDTTKCCKAGRSPSFLRHIIHPLASPGFGPLSTFGTWVTIHHPRHFSNARFQLQEWRSSSTPRFDWY